MTIVHITYHNETNIGSCPIGQTGGFENADGNGEIHCFRIFDGVSVMLMQLEMGSYTEIRTQVGVLEVNFCINGRFETSFSMRSHVLLKPGDMAISCYDGLHGTKSESHFPLGYYEGLCLEIDPAAAGTCCGSVLLCRADGAGTPSPGSSADEPGGICVSCPSGSGA